jgi:hypothetical protein
LTDYCVTPVVVHMRNKPLLVVRTMRRRLQPPYMSPPEIGEMLISSPPTTYSRLRWLLPTGKITSYQPPTLPLHTILHPRVARRVAIPPRCRMVQVSAPAGGGEGPPMIDTYKHMYAHCYRCLHTSVAPQLVAKYCVASTWWSVPLLSIHGNIGCGGPPVHGSRLSGDGISLAVLETPEKLETI